ncbi:uncharacterized protein LOC106176508 [Lingula anatina]|uniref:Uncharacterized protein LOC106176508 n=1 Tax=Lingula anatina TaxID=7574 RepID=A0A1S3JVF3_LINAN|nr:uncharacterized protein LOC106176508 [Lingula anatina]|eukprot:XP_013414385.1 uncharacterized protein LOC106176508 [Lingula anatina]
MSSTWTSLVPLTSPDPLPLQPPLPSVPMPTNISALWCHTNLTISWENPAEGSADVLHTEILLLHNNSYLWETRTLICKHCSNITVKGLEDNNKYTIQLRAHTGSGRSNYSDSLVISPGTTTTSTSQHCPGQADDITVLLAISIGGAGGGLLLIIIIILLILLGTRGKKAKTQETTTCKMTEIHTNEGHLSTTVNDNEQQSRNRRENINPTGTSQEEPAQYMSINVYDEAEERNMPGHSNKKHVPTSPKQMDGSHYMNVNGGGEDVAPNSCPKYLPPSASRKSSKKFMDTYEIQTNPTTTSSSWKTGWAKQVSSLSSFLGEKKASRKQGHNTDTEYVNVNEYANIKR